MMIRMFTIGLLLVSCAITCGQESEKADTNRPELKLIEAMVGVWDADVQVWAQGLDAPPMKFKGTETNRAYGKHWLSSDFDSTVMGQTIKVHSIIGYDLDKKKLVGRTIDHGPYAADMVGEFDKDSNTIHWTTKVKDPGEKMIVQKTSITQTSDTERVLVLKSQGANEGEFNKFMEIKFVKRK